MSLSEGNVILYCTPNPPGLQKIHQFVEIQPGKTEKRDEVYAPFLRARERHLALWKVYVFANGLENVSQINKLAEVSEEVIGLRNEITKPKQQAILLYNP